MTMVQQKDRARERFDFSPKNTLVYICIQENNKQGRDAPPRRKG